VKCLGRRMPLFAPIADDTFEIDEPTVGVEHDWEDVALQSFGVHGAIPNDILIHQPSEHYVAGQRNLHDCDLEPVLFSSFKPISP
jgi:hypothetical protein